MTCIVRPDRGRTIICFQYTVPQVLIPKTEHAPLAAVFLAPDFAGQRAVVNVDVTSPQPST